MQVIHSRLRDFNGKNILEREREREAKAGHEQQMRKDRIAEIDNIRLSTCTTKAESRVSFHNTKTPYIASQTLAHIKPIRIVQPSPVAFCSSSARPFPHSLNSLCSAKTTSTAINKMMIHSNLTPCASFRCCRSTLAISCA